MKINNSNKINFNPYQDQIKKQANTKKDTNKKDQLEISTQAKQLHQSKQSNTKRAAYVQDIKNEIETGTFKVNYEQTAKKMIDYWSKL